MAWSSPSLSPGSPRRCAPNLPGSLTRSLSKRLGVDATTAMRIALLYGDMEWLAGGDSQLRYSASDYGRRQGLHRHTVASDLRRLQDIRAIHITQDSCSASWIQLLGLDEMHPVEQINTPVDDSAMPLSIPTTSPCRFEHQPPVERTDTPLSSASTTLEKGFKTQEKRREEAEGEGSNSQPLPPPLSEQVTNQPKPEAPAPVSASRPSASAVASQPSGHHPAPPSRPSSLSSPASEQEPAKAELAEPEAHASKTSAEPAALLDRLLAAFQAAKPPEWPSPSTLTLSPGRRGKLQAALRYAGSADALLQRLQTALAHVPPWFVTTYPVRPDGSRRPSHQFFDLLFRATGDEREGGLEAWHLFAWSEAGARGAEPSLGMGGMGGTGGTAQGHSAPETDLERAKRLFRWNCHDWLMREVEAIRLPLSERRRLTALLEADGRGTPGAGAIQFADPPEPDPANQPQKLLQAANQDPYHHLDPFPLQHRLQGQGEASAASADA
jgi:hypothetical protein